MTASPMEFSVTWARSFSSNSAPRDRRTFDHAAERLPQQVTVEAILQQIVLRAACYRQLGDVLILGITQDQNRNLGRDGKNPFESINPMTVGQGEVEQNRRYVVRASLFLFTCLGQSFQSVGAVPDPVDLVRLITSVDQRGSNDRGACRIVLDQ
jgi:hypothetical protein